MLSLDRLDRYVALPNYNYYDVEGTGLLILDKSVGKPLRDYKVYGNSVQNGTPTPDAPVEIESCGEKTKNLVDISALVGYQGDTMTKTTAEGNTLTLHSSLSSAYIYISADKSKKGLFDRLKPSTTYRIKYSSRFLEGSSSSSQGRIVFVNSSYAAKQTFYIGRATTVGRIVTLDGTFKTPADMSEYNQILIYGAYGEGSRTEIIDWIVTEESEAIEPYEPYGYKIPIKVSGNNLVDYSTVKSEMAVSGTTGVASANSARMCTDYIYVKNATKISINLGASFAFYDKDKVFISGETKSTAIFRNYAIPLGAHYIRFDWVTQTVGENIVYAVAGSYTAKTMPSYEPYREPEIYNIYLYEPLRKTSNPYADYIDFRNGKVVKLVKVDDNTGALSIEESLSVLETPVEEDIELPDIKLHKGTNVITVVTQIQPSNIAVQYYK